MSIILSLLTLLVGATAVIAIGTRVSLYFYTQEESKAHPIIAARGPVASQEAPIILERSEILYKADSMRYSSRYALIGMGVITLFILLAILVIVSFLSGVVL